MDEGQMGSAFRWSIWLSCAYMFLGLLLYVFQPQVKLVFGAPAKITGSRVVDPWLFWAVVDSSLVIAMCMRLEKSLRLEKEGRGIMTEIATIVLFIGCLQAVEFFANEAWIRFAHHPAEQLASIGSLLVPEKLLSIMPYIAQALLLTQAGYSLGRKGYGRMKRIVIPAAFGLWALGVVWALTVSRLGEIGRTWSVNYHDFYEGNVLLPTDMAPFLIILLVCLGLAMCVHKGKPNRWLRKWKITGMCVAAAFFQCYVDAAVRLTAQMWINVRGSSFIAAHSSLEKLLLPARMLGNSGVSLMWIVFGVFLGSASGLWMNAVQKEVKAHQRELNHSI